METPTICSSRPRLNRISVIFGAKEMILFGGKGKATFLPTSSTNFKGALCDNDGHSVRKSDRIKKDLKNCIFIEVEI
jgi:hypothetical protein